MEIQKSPIENLEELAPKAAEYIELLLEVLGDFETAEYAKHPEGVLTCFSKGIKGFKEDQNEIIFHLHAAIGEKEEMREKIVAVLESLKQNLRDRPVSAFALKPVFDFLSPPQRTKDETAPPVNEKIKIANLHYTAGEMKDFLHACGLKPGTTEGSHTHWHDAHGRRVSTTSSSKKLWLKNEIRALFGNGIPLEVIVEACRKLKINFQIISR